MNIKFGCYHELLYCFVRYPSLINNCATTAMVVSGGSSVLHGDHERELVGNGFFTTNDIRIGSISAPSEMVLC